ncbi:hypothetical protein KGF54_005488 [Candida jiufengensis]|uniref:uncharacterized protein n=1 Tax=Candida jiufengensis TaxID=497108 RepID=UPI002223F3D1|nr:uncharacterized protein KGF54_005488 [Candida jiufengensis]KAI5949610.1 hypothetical protein KGF54_005488 [Candida jiufengensis]
MQNFDNQIYYQQVRLNLYEHISHQVQNDTMKRLMKNDIIKIIFRRYNSSLTKLQTSAIRPNDLTNFGDSIFDIAKELTNLTKKSESLRSNFTQAIINKNTNYVSGVLSELKNETTETVSTEERLNYLQITINFYIQTGVESLSKLNHVVQEYASMIQTLSKKNDVFFDLQPHVRTLLEGILKIHDDSDSLIIKSAMKSLFKQITDEYKVNLQVLKNSLPISLQQILGELYQLETPSSREIVTSYLTASIEPYLNEFGSLSFREACSYISKNKFEWNNKVISEPLFEFYDTLPEIEKQQFLEAYLAFNQIKQTNLESNLSKLQPKSDINPQNLQASFISSQHELVIKWVDESTKYLSDLISFDTPITDEEKILSNFKPLMETFTIQSLVTLVVHLFIGQSIQEEIAIADVLSRLRFYYNKNIRSIKSQNYKSQLLELMSENSFDKFSNILIDSVLRNCEIDGHEVIDTTFKVNDSSSSNHQLAFILATTFSKNKKKLVIRVNPIIQKLMSSISHTINDFTHHFPLLHPPSPWLGTRKGAFLDTETRFVSGNDSLHKSILTKLYYQGKLDSGLRCLDQMGQTAWCINPDMLNFFNQIMKSPQGFLDIPPKEIHEKDRKKSIELKSLRLNYEMINQLANAFGTNGDILYHVYMFDFRGRVYALSPLSHYGGDLTRSLFTFWFSQPLGDNGFYWIKYQLVAMFGNGYQSEDCEQFFEKYKDQILDSANDSLTNKWWMRADEPFSTLSLCYEIRKILDYQANGGVIENYLCRVPIHQDGSCNGLQHYAALAADEDGGKAVNLLPEETKQDVYSTIRDIVEKKVKDDIAQGVLEEKKLDDAKLFLKILDRKLVKRPVMTTVYGVTLNGASKQILENINNIVSDHYENPSKRKYNQDTINQLKNFRLTTTNYLAEKVLNSIDELFYNAKNLEDWLVLNIRRILTSYNLRTLNYLELKQSKSMTDLKNLNNWYKTPINFEPINWISPAGFPVIQIYRNLPKQIIKGVLGSIMKYKTSELTSMDRRKHELAIAPNFIHSLDASHMFLTCNECFNQGITFTSIHDSYWTYPDQVEQLSTILREKFIELHSFDYMNTVKSGFEKQMMNSFQLCYFEKDENLELFEFLKKRRSNYNERKINDQLNIELKELTLERENHEILKMVKKNNPKLFHIVGSKVFKYDTNLSTSQTEIIPKPKHLVPVLVPVQILDLPKKGNLDINQVKKSKYFFS